ncbi:hypothetical protein NQ318_000508 [Aromia moschata]|uniref:Nidogen n=1 Tax=Aromia moschata TaxID=1265417 RepID=A0AAV8YEJ2_9CUCU|nr:hypothetical protein NQ318_000508 [Aromia moschata]
MRLILWCFLCFSYAEVRGIPASLLYDHDGPGVEYLPKDNDVSSEEIRLREPVVFYGTPFESIYVNSNGFLSFQTEIPHFINVQFPLDYPIIAPFYSNVDTRNAGAISFYETDNPVLLDRATENVHEAFINSTDFQATTLFIVTWDGTYFYRYRGGLLQGGNGQSQHLPSGADHRRLRDVCRILVPQNGIQWIQGTGDESGLPDARAQAGFISPDRKIFTLPGSGTEQVTNLERWSNIGFDGQFIYKVDGADIAEPDASFATKKSSSTVSCAEAPTFCHVQANCIDYEEGLCCECNPKYYGNGIFCVKKDVPLRVNGKIHGNINGEQLDGLDLQSYIAMADGRAYTAVSKIPTGIGFDSQSLQILGGISTDWGVFNHTATVTFFNTSQVVRIKQKFLGLDVFDQLRLEADIQGDIPHLPIDSKVIIDEYEEQYTLTGPGDSR